MLRGFVVEPEDVAAGVIAVDQFLVFVYAPNARCLNSQNVKVEPCAHL
jgi:hypothetical protein